MMVCWFSAIKTIGIHVAHMYKSLFQLTNCDSRECCRWYSQNRVKNLTFFPRFFQITPPKHACPKRGLQYSFDPKNKLVSCSVSTHKQNTGHTVCLRFIEYRPNVTAACSTWNLTVFYYYGHFSQIKTDIQKIKQLSTRSTV